MRLFHVLRTAMDSTEQPQPELLTAPEVAQRLRISVRQVYLMAESGELPAVRIGDRIVRFSAAGLETYLQNAAS